MGRFAGFISQWGWRRLLCRWTFRNPQMEKPGHYFTGQVLGWFPAVPVQYGLLWQDRFPMDHLAHECEEVAAIPQSSTFNCTERRPSNSLTCAAKARSNRPT